MKLLSVVLTSGQELIGQVADDDGLTTDLTLNNPMRLSVLDTPQGPIMMLVPVARGFHITSLPIAAELILAMGDPQDPNLINGYIQSTTGIQVAQPSRGGLSLVTP
jgi:hypothetical protein